MVNGTVAKRRTGCNATGGGTTSHGTEECGEGCDDV